MPSTHHPKIRRKDLKQPDEFMTLAGKAQELLLLHLQKVFIALAAIVVLAAAVFAFSRYEQGIDREIAEQFYQGFSAFNSKQYKNAEQILSQLVTNHPDREPGRLARLYLGLSYFNSGDMANARDALEQYVGDAKDASLHEMALMDLGVVYEQLREFAKAERSYRDAAALSGPDNLEAQLSIARVLAQEGKRDAAIEAYRSFLQANPYAGQRTLVVEALAELGVATPASPTGP